MARPTPAFTLWVELFGTPRLRSGRSQVELALTTPVSRRQVIGILAQACPELVGHAIRNDLSDLEDGFVFNLGGKNFLQGDNFPLEPGDSLLLLSSQAGG